MNYVRGGKGSVECEECDASLVVPLWSTRGGYTLVRLESLREDLSCSATLAFFLYSSLRYSVEVIYLDYRLLISGPFTRSITGLKCDYIVCQCLLCQCFFFSPFFLMPLSINIGFAIPVHMGKGWALLYV